MNRNKFISILKNRFSLRLHMTLILLATSVAGVLASKGLFVIGLHNVAIRYPVNVLCAYLVFFAAIKVWLWIMNDAPVRSLRDSGHHPLD